MKKTFVPFVLALCLTACSSTTDEKPSAEPTETTEVETTTEETTEAETFEQFPTAQLSNEKVEWYFNSNNEHIRPTGASDYDFLKKYHAYYMGEDEQVIYLTFDEGYENGYSEKILDVLKEKNVKGAFFVTQTYIRDNPELIKRMVAEGHIVGNHSVQHKSSPDLSDEEFMNELTETADYFKEITGQEMPKIFRPPMGHYSERTLALANNLGYKTILWSFAHADWDVDNQPGKEQAYETVMKRYHNGAIMLLHAVSQSNTEALGDIIDSLTEKGYRFDTLDNL